MKIQCFRTRYFLAILAIAGSVQAQFSWPGCDDAAAGHFSVKPIVTREKDDLHKPLKIAFHKVGEQVNFYFIEMGGRVRYYKDGANAVEEVGKVPAHLGGTEDGLTGIALDPGFDANRKMYLFYSINGFYRLARYLVTGGNQLDMASMKVFLDVPKKNGAWHSSGSMEFDAYGDLWMGIGDNFQFENVALSTKNYLASIIRIHPDDSPKGYSIPKDNLGEYWGRKFQAQGEADLGRQYLDPNIVYPEIYVKGVRNPYTAKVVHPTKRWIAFGDVGPDAKGGNTEEFNILKEPGFMGWPIYAGAKQVNTYSGVAFKHDGITTLPAGLSKGGAGGLPPVIDGLYNIPQACAMSGPIYWYNGLLSSSRKFPPHFNGKWFVAENNRGWTKVLTLDDAFQKVTSEANFLAGLTEDGPEDLKFGPDGALYMVYYKKPWFGDNAANRITRIEYTGNCRPHAPVPDFLTPVSLQRAKAASSRRTVGGLHVVDLSGWNLEGRPVALFDFLGKGIPLQPTGNGVYRFRNPRNAGMLFLKVGGEVVKVAAPD